MGAVDETKFDCEIEHQQGRVQFNFYNFWDFDITELHEKMSKMF